uniref:Capsid protein n=1 Tax=Parvoviridae sp. TaxID=1940570 RepID=A0A7D3V1H4_9VIRU|nr:MAG: capsid protein [Parvoviridae sp.]
MAWKQRQDYDWLRPNRKTLSANDYKTAPAPQNDYFAGNDKGGRKSTKPVKSVGKQRSEQSEANRRRFFIIQALKKKAANKGPGGKSKQKLKHLDPELVQLHKAIAESRKNIPKPKPPAKLSVDVGDPEEGPAPKQPRLAEPEEDPDILEEVMAPGNEPDSTMDMDIPDGLMTESGEGGAGGGGPGGVGKSTGNWSCETVWGENTISTYASRHCVCLPRDNDAYKLIGYMDNDTTENTINAENESNWLGFSTPWNYIDFNRYSVFFSPRDWQRLLNTAARWRPRRVGIKIFNIQVINKTQVQGGGTQYNNDLSGTIQVFADQAGQFPKLTYPSQTTCMGSFPNMIYYTPQYCYITGSEAVPAQTTERHLAEMCNAETGFFVLDEHNSIMLRTGDDWSSEFQFDQNMPWCKNLMSSRSIMRRMNPIYDTYIGNCLGVDAKLGSFDTWRQPYLPGPYMKSSIPLDAESVTATMSQVPHVSVAGHRVTTIPGPPFYTTEAGDYIHTHPLYIRNEQGMNEGDNADVDITDHTNKFQRVSVSTKNQKFIGPGGPYWQNEVSASTQNPQNLVGVPWSGMQPSMVWDERPTSYFDCIWQEMPDSDHKFIPQPPTGGIPCVNSPGHVFVKVTPKPNGQVSGLIDQYATFTVTVAIEWEWEPYNPN